MSFEARIFHLSQDLSGQWTVPILLTLEQCRGRFTPLQHQLRITPTRLSDNLKRMVKNGLLKHLSPHERRHPALPEYVFTEKGRFYKEAASTIQIAEKHIGFGRLSSKAWNFPVLLALHYEYERFQEIRHALERVTPKTLSTRLDELHSIGAVNKLLIEQPRPTFLYHLDGDIKPPVRQLAVDLQSII